MATSTDSNRSAAASNFAAASGWAALAAGILGIVLYGISVATPWSLSDPLGLHPEPAPDPATYQRVLNGALDQAWTLLGGSRGAGSGGVRFTDLTKDPDRLHRAGQLIDGVLASRPNDSRAYVLQALMHLASGETEAARGSLERSLETGGGQQSLLVLGTLHAHVGEIEEAEAVFRRTVAEYPRSVSAWNNLGQALSQLGRQGEAEEAFRRRDELQTAMEAVTSAETPAREAGDQ